jgi:hypothetical protein
VVPDTEYFVRRQLISVWSHTFLGLFIYCLPIGLILLWLFNTYQKTALIGLLPASFQCRLVLWSGPFHFLPPQRLCLIGLSIIAGAATHLAWDSLTHANGLLAHWKLLPLRPLFALAGVPITADRLLQDGSTLIGLLLLSGWIWRTITHIQPQPMSSDYILPTQIKRYHCIGLIVISLVVASFVWFLLEPALSADPRRRFLQQMMLSLIPAVYLTITVYGIGIKLNRCWKHTCETVG